MLRNGFEDDFYEHIPQVKSGEDKQWIKLKRMLITGPVPTPYTTVQHFFPADIPKAKNGEFLIAVYFGWDVLILSLVFPHDYVCIFLIVWQSFQL